jgi:gamma-D-glutamyl-L-lysine dipeptidyl-peptidase
MPIIEINGAGLYYETYGKEKPGQAPILLIHGSTGTGRSNWKEAAPLLGRSYFVIVPDCRGHGKSTNPDGSYFFKEMAADAAALVRALGYPKAHIIGHSNGGNVALVVLLEHPEVVQTAIPQAANAWVSPDLIEKEPALFDPERVRQEAPDWMEEMIELHSETHGAEYWRDLLQMTVKEIISEPNYTPQDLAAVQRPTLVIQGEIDRVNAPFKHAQFIARHIPHAELWIPKNTGHSVHEEILFEWIEIVLDFLKRRGDDANDSIYRLGQDHYSDRRDWIFDLQAEPLRLEDREDLRLRGRVLTPAQRQDVLDLFNNQKIDDQTRVLLDGETPWALVNKPVTDLRRAPGRDSERVTQALLGEVVRILEEAGEWAWVRLEHDGYMGWLQANALHHSDKAQVDQYQQSCSHLVAAETAPALSSPENGIATGKLVFGTLVAVDELREGMAAVCRPDGSRWWVGQHTLLPLSEQPTPDSEGIAQTLTAMRGLVGVPYLWGGRTPFGYDCSGLASTFWKYLGVQLPRDADQQSKIGALVEGPPFQPGDLLFFGEKPEDVLQGQAGSEEYAITHVAISLGGSELLHAAGSADCVTVNSLNPDSPVFSAWLNEHLVIARRPA